MVNCPLMTWFSRHLKCHTNMSLKISRLQIIWCHKVHPIYHIMVEVSILCHKIFYRVDDAKGQFTLCHSQYSYC